MAESMEKNCIQLKIILFKYAENVRDDIGVIKVLIISFSVYKTITTNRFFN